MRKLIEIGQAREAKFVVTVHHAVAGKRRLEAEGLAGVGAHALRTPANHIALLGQEENQLRMRARYVRSIFFHVEKSGGILALRPISAHQDPRASLDAAVLLFPSFNVLLREEKIVIRSCFAR